MDSPTRLLLVVESVKESSSKYNSPFVLASAFIDCIAGAPQGSAHNSIGAIAQQIADKWPIIVFQDGGRF